jgi:lipopolysaccharide assembly protein A
MKIKTIFVLVLMILVALFSVQNAATTTVRFLTWQFAMSQALVIMLSVFCGALVGLVLGTVGGRQRSRPGDIPPSQPDTP